MPSAAILSKAKSEVEATLLKHKPPNKKDDYFNLQHYIGTQLDVIGVKIPVARKLFKNGYSFSGLEAEEQYLIWKYIWFSSDTFDVMTQALFFCDQYIKLAEPVYFFEEMQEWLQRVDNWAHSDTITHYFAALHEKNAGHRVSCFAKMEQIRKSVGTPSIYSQLVGLCTLSQIISFLQKNNYISNPFAAR